MKEEAPSSARGVWSSTVAKTSAKTPVTAATITTTTATKSPNLFCHLFHSTIFHLILFFLFCIRHNAGYELHSLSFSLSLTPLIHLLLISFRVRLNRSLMCTGCFNVLLRFSWTVNWFDCVYKYIRVCVCVRVLPLFFHPTTHVFGVVPLSWWILLHASTSQSERNPLTQNNGFLAGPKSSSLSLSLFAWNQPTFSEYRSNSEQNIYKYRECARANTLQTSNGLLVLFSLITFHSMRIQQ